METSLTQPQLIDLCAYMKLINAARTHHMDPQGRRVWRATICGFLNENKTTEIEPGLTSDSPGSRLLCNYLQCVCGEQQLLGAKPWTDL